MPDEPIIANFAYDMVHLMQGDCLDRLRELDDCSVDAVITDPPYGLGAKQPDMAEVLTHWLAGDDYRMRGGGFMGKSWDSFVPGPVVWKEVFRVLKPGGHMAVFGGTRTYDLLVTAIRLSGFDIRDQLAWVYATGFPKSHDVGQSVEKLQTTGRTQKTPRDMGGHSHDRFEGTGEGSWLADSGGKVPLTTDDARRLEGWGTALKPAYEPICLARKPVEKPKGRKKLTVAENMLMYGTGGVNVDFCRIEGAKPSTIRGAGGQNGAYGPLGAQGLIVDDGLGRFPANFTHDASADVMLGFPEDEKARFFYSPKASKEDRAGSRHPTVKPVALMAWLIRLLTPVGGVALDPFAGTGTTGAAIASEGVYAGILIERERQYCEDIIRRFEGFEIRQEGRNAEEPAPEAGQSRKARKPRAARRPTVADPGQTSIFDFLPEKADA